MQKRGKLTTIFGGQYGSEGKGAVVAAIADDYQVHVRVGAPNAGHSFVHKPSGKLFKMQTIPVGWCNPNAVLVIGRGGLVDPLLLKQEIKAIAAVDPSIVARLFIDTKCGVLDACFHKQEGGVDGEMHKRIGSTGEGVGPAREARISRDPHKFRHFGDLASEDPFFAPFALNNTPTFLDGLQGAGDNILLEGSQGQGLSLIHGPWPFCTSNECGPSQLCADVGVPAHRQTDVIACFRTYPIRVAGNSGPLNKEITWAELSERLGKPVEEKTTVTKKIRRIGEWDDELAIQCRTLHRPTELALMFLDYISPEDEGKEHFGELSDRSVQFIQRVEDVMDAPVTLIGTGGPTFTVIDVRERD